MWAEHGLEAEQALKRSLTHHKFKGHNIPDEAGQEHTVTTVGLLFLLMHMKKTRRGNDDKKRSEAVLFSFLACTLDGDDILNSPFHQLPSDCGGCCA